MPWAVARLRGQKVYARARPDGSLESTAGRVEIRYKLGDVRAYRAGLSNLSLEPGEALLSDDAFAAEAAPTSGAPPSSGGDPSSRPVSSVPRSSSSSAARSRLDSKHASREEPVRTPGGWLAYTDGACSGNPGPAGAGMVIIQPGGKIDEGYEYLGMGTNNVAELTAILRALEIVPADAPSLVVHTDSQYAIGVLTKGWKAKANQDLVAKTKEALAARPQARLAYVPGHAGVPMNERADELAREAIRTSRTKPVQLAVSSPPSTT